MFFFFFNCKLGITMKDKRIGMVKYTYLMQSMIKAMHIIPQLTICVYNVKITVDMLA